MSARNWNNAGAWNTAARWNGDSVPIFAGPRDPLPRVVVEVDAPGGTLWYSDGRYIDPAAGVVAQARIARRVSFERRASTAFWGGGRAFQGVGSVELINTDGGLDYLLGVQLRRRVVRVWLGTEDTPVSALVLCARAIIERVETVGESAFRLILADASQELETPLQTETFTAGPLEGLPLPVTLGICYSVPALQAEAPLLRYTLHDATGLGGMIAVTDSGVTLTQTTQWDDYNTAPTFGFILNQSTAGQILGDVLGPGAGIATENARLPRLVEYLLGTRRGLASSRWDGAGLGALDTELNQPELGRWVGEPLTYASALDEVADSIGGWWTIDPDGVMRIDRLRLPSGSPALVLDRSRLGGEVQVEFDSAPGLAGAVLGSRNWRPLAPSEQAGSVRDTAEGVALAREFRSRVPFPVAAIYAEAEGAQGRGRPGMQTDEAGMPTLLANTASCEDEATRRAELWDGPRWWYRVPALLDATAAATIPLGTVIELRLPRFGLDSGRLLRVMGVRGEFGARRVELLCWGAGPEIEPEEEES
jgi:hypothetical protein